MLNWIREWIEGRKLRKLPPDVAIHSIAAEIRKEVADMPADKFVHGALGMCDTLEKFADENRSKSHD